MFKKNLQNYGQGGRNVKFGLCGTKEKEMPPQNKGKRELDLYGLFV